MKTNQSSPIHFLDLAIPEIKEFSFVYNFFEPKELVEEQKKPNLTTSSDENILKNSRKFPRYNQLNIISNFPNIEELKLEEGESLIDKIDQIYSQNDLSKISTSTLLLSDTEVSQRAQRTILRSGRIREINGSLTDISLKLSEDISFVNPNLLQEFSGKIESFLNASFNKNNALIESNESIKNVNSAIQINSRYVFDVINSREKVPFGNYSILSDINKSRQIQEESRRINQFAGKSNYIVELSSLDFELTDEYTTFNRLSLVGIAIFRKEKLSIDADEFRLLDIVPPTASYYRDFEIKTNTKYDYFVSNVFLAKIGTSSSEFAEPGIARFLLMSSYSNPVSISTVDKVPPPPPADFVPRWDYQERCLVLSWSMPVNSQRDIKYFQVLRRRNIQEPFELLVEYDFNDIEGFIERGDVPLQGNQRTLNSPLTIFIDKEFRKNSDFIYTLVSVDAKGLVSNYSEQLRIRFDSIRNRILINQISPSGAPRIYPNAFVRSDLFIDSIIEKNKRKMSVYFDPEYLKIIDDDNNDLNLIRKKDDGRYLISVIDIDRGQIIKIPLTVQDLR